MKKNKSKNEQVETIDTETEQQELLTPENPDVLASENTETQLEENNNTQEEQNNVEEQEEGPKQSWKELRQKAEKAEQLQKERDEYFRILKQIEEEAKRYAEQDKKSSEIEIEDDFDYNTIDDDEILTGKELKRAWQKEQKRLKYLEDSIKSQKKASEEARIEAELKSKYTDFYDVLNADNISKLRELRPGLAKSLALNPDLKEQATETYQAIKDLGIYKDEYSPDRELAKKNAAKPRPINSISPQRGNSPLSQANAFASGLTDDLKKQLYKEMIEKSKSR